jgi:hypothetical protein
MSASSLQASGSFDWLHSDQSFVADREHDLELTSVRILQMNGRFLYLKWAEDLTQFDEDQQRVLNALARHGDTVFVALGPDSNHVRLSYRMPNLEDAVAFDPDGLRGLIAQWFVWASSEAA